MSHRSLCWANVDVRVKERRDLLWQTTSVDRNQDHKRRSMVGRLYVQSMARSFIPRLAGRAARQRNASRAQNFTPKLVKKVASAAVPLSTKPLLSRGSIGAHRGSHCRKPLCFPISRIFSKMVAHLLLQLQILHHLFSSLATPGGPGYGGRVSLPGCVAGEPEEQARVVVAQYEVRRISRLVAMTQPGWLI